MNHELLLYCVLFGGFLGWGLWEWKRTRYKPMLWNEETGAFEPYKPLIQSVDFAMNTQQQFIRPKASQFPELDWGLLKAMEERRKLVNCWAEVIIDNQLFSVGFDIPKNVQDEIIIGTFLTPEERAKYFD